MCVCVGVVGECSWVDGYQCTCGCGCTCGCVGVGGCGSVDGYGCTCGCGCVGGCGCEYIEVRVECGYAYISMEGTQTLLCVVDLC